MPASRPLRKPGILGFFRLRPKETGEAIIKTAREMGKEQREHEQNIRTERERFNAEQELLQLRQRRLEKFVARIQDPEMREQFVEFIQKASNTIERGRMEKDTKGKRKYSDADLEKMVRPPLENWLEDYRPRSPQNPEIANFIVRALFAEQ